VIRFYLDPDAGGWRWRLVSRTQRGADLLARGPVGHDPAAALEQLTLLSGAGRPRFARNGDGHWQWILAGADGTAVAESPPVYRDRLSCEQAFTDARRAAATVARSYGDALQLPRAAQARLS
jgi:hypothetical protein